MTTARQFAEELERRAIACETDADDAEKWCSTRINNASVTIYFSRALDGDVRWQAGDEMLRRSREVTASDLVGDVIDSLISPA